MDNNVYLLVQMYLFRVLRHVENAALPRKMNGEFSGRSDWLLFTTCSTFEIQTSGLKRKK